MKRFNACGFAQGATALGGFSPVAGVRFPSNPVASGKVSIGGTLSVAASPSPSTATLSYQWKRAGSSIAGATGSIYTPVSADIGFDITCTVTAVKGNRTVTSTTNVVSYSLGQTTGLKYAYAANAANDGTITTLSDFSGNSRTLTGSGSTSYPYPLSFPRNWAQNGNPVFGFDLANTQNAIDFGASSASYADFLNQPGMGVVFRGQVFDGANTILFGNSDTTVNQNGMYVMYDNTNFLLKIVKTSTSGSGTTHLSYNTATGSLKPGDVFQLTFVHNSDRTWSVKVIREARTPSDTRTTITSSGTSTANANSGASYGFAVGSSPIGSLYTSMRVQNLMVFSASSTTAADVADWEAYCNNKFNFNFLTFDSDVSTTFTTANIPSFLNWNATAAAAAANQAKTLEQAVVNAMGLSGSSVKVGVIGDQRAVGAGTTIGTNDYRTMIQFGSGSFNFTRVPVGPINDGTASAAKNHFAITNAIERAQTSPYKVGHSQRSSNGSTTIDTYVGAGKSYNDVRIWNWVIGGGAWPTVTFPLIRDNIDELARIWEYCIQQQQANAGITPGFVLHTLNVHRTNGNGVITPNIRNYNREMHAMVSYMRNQGYTVKFGNLNKEDVNP